MPVEWVGSPDGAPEISGASSHAAGEPPLVRLHLWPHRSLPKRGFVLFIAITFLLLMMPLVAVLGTPVLWGLLPFLLAALGLTWALLQKSYRDGEILEELCLWSDHAVLHRRQARRAAQTWEANPYWISLQLHAKGGPVPSYLTLKGSGREVELGAFLSKDEREDLHQSLQAVLARVLSATGRPPTD